MLAVLLLSSGLAGCSDDRDTVAPPPSGRGGDPCTAIGCEDGLNIQFSVSQPGIYLFNIVADDLQVSCSATLPLPSCDSPGSTCGDPRVQLGASGCALEPSAHSLEGLSLLGMQPAQVTVIAIRDGEQLAAETFTPAYQMLAPNGEECGPICMNATVALPLGDAP